MASSAKSNKEEKTDTSKAEKTYTAQQKKSAKALIELKEIFTELKKQGIIIKPID